MNSSFVGKVIDNYRVLESLGVGGMGVVFKAVNIKLEKLVALKMIAPGLAMNENFIKRFQTEAKALAKLADPNIVQIYDLRTHEDQWLIVMEFIDGLNLGDKIKKDGAFPINQAISILKQMLSAIGHAHKAGIIHRDIKPNNVMITETGQVKITDFGLAKSESIRTNSYTISGGGTLFYMSPEHVKSISLTDGRSDIYSIGMTFYEMVAGRVPFHSMDTDFEIRETIVRKELEKPSHFNSEVPAELEKIILTSIAKEPEERYQTPDEMLAAVQEFEVKYFLQNDGDPPPKPEAKQTDVDSSASGFNNVLVEKVVEPDKKKKNLWPMAIFLVLILFSVGVYFKYFDTSPEPAPIFSHLSVSSNPAMANVSINNSHVGTTPLNNHELEPGQYSINVQKDKYNPIDTTILLDRDHPANLVLELTVLESVPVQTVSNAIEKPVPETPAFASLAITSQPPGATIWLDNEQRGETPLVIEELAGGNYQIRLQLEKHESYEQEILLSPDRSNEIKTVLKLLPGSLAVVTNPEGANILIDGSSVSDKTTPVTIDAIQAGEHRLKLIKNGYASESHTFKIEPDDLTNLNFELTQLFGNLIIQVKPWGSIFIDDQLIQTSTDIQFTAQLPAEKHKLKIVHPTLGYWEKFVQVNPDQSTEISLNFNRDIPLTIAAFDENGQPVWAEIFVDNKDMSQTTPGEIKIHPGIHKITVRKAGFVAASGEREILIDDTENDPLTFILKKIE